MRRFVSQRECIPNCLNMDYRLGFACAASSGALMLLGKRHWCKQKLGGFNISVAGGLFNNRL